MAEAAKPEQRGFGRGGGRGRDRGGRGGGRGGKRGDPRGRYIFFLLKTANLF